ncbi:shikimate dehydrogenase [Aurantiacibacter aquimixticola]|uniref:Shikimate dehydrogenase (NADP(+)) n=1 Tax=Aurantiacibacter aquimixticola TaxID=1958945 RepID=A0A419RUV7_9SPHN|nr:shikimate dehydrogenase [Aurantiacibacter aquimixticola]RJY09569.1 shikimate dehydrogenase [Aurantiacibacter aquimixticola]
MSIYAEVIGDPIAHSKSPLIHNYWLQKLGIDADYHALYVTPDRLAAYIASRRDDPNWRGCNVTMPHKQAIIPLLDRLEIGAELVGATNTVTRRHNGALIGTNTDVEGFLEPLSDMLEAQHYFRMARIIGTGGAARAIAAALAENGFTLVVIGRDVEKAAHLLSAIDSDGEHHVAPLDHFAKPTDFAFDDREGCLDLVVNASPLGMAGQPPLHFDLSHAPPGSIVYDIVTDPRETPLLKAAKAAGFATIDGLSMLIGQAAIAFERFFGQPPPRADGDLELREILTR